MEENECDYIEKQLSYFRSHIHGWEGHEGQFALIRNEKAVGFYSSYDIALQQGYQQFNLEPFIVKQVNLIEHPLTISRFIQPYTISQ